MKSKKLDSNMCIDLICLGLPWQLSEIELREYFQSFGPIKMAVVTQMNSYYYDNMVASCI